MQYQLVDNNQKYEIEADEERPEDVAKLIKAMDIFYDLKQQYEGIKEQYDQARTQMEKAFGVGFDTFRLRKIKGDYMRITYVPETQGTVKKSKVINETKVKMLMDEFGIDESQYIDEVEKEVGGKKAFIQVKAE